MVVSGFGTRAQWFRNIEADDRVRVWVGARSAMRAGARRLGPEDASIALGRYAEARPRAWSALRPVLEQTLGAHIDEDGTELPMVALELAGRPDAGA